MCSFSSTSTQLPLNFQIHFFPLHLHMNDYNYNTPHITLSFPFLKMFIPAVCGPDAEPMDTYPISSLLLLVLY